MIAPQHIPDDDASERLFALQGWVMCAGLVIAASAYSYRLMSFMHAKEAILTVALVLMAVLTARRRARLLPGLAWFLPLWLALGFALCCSLARAPLPARAVEDATRAAILLLMASLGWEHCRHPKWRLRILAAIAVSAGVTGTFALGQYFRVAEPWFPRFPHYDQPMYSVFGNQDLLGGYVAIAIPLLLSGLFLASRRTWIAGSLLALLISVLVLSGSRSAWLATALGVLAAMPWRTRPSRAGAVWLIVILLVLLGVAAGTWSQTTQRLSSTFTPSDVGGRARLWFWDGTLRMIRDHPWCGVGLGNYAYFSPLYLGEALAAPGGHRHYRNEIHTEHAHSEPLEYLAETGVIGGALLLWMLCRTVRRPNSAFGAFTALLVFAMFNAAFHSPPHALAGLLICAMARTPDVHHCKMAAQPPQGTKLLLLPVAALALGGLAAWTILLPSYRLRAAEDVHLAGGNPAPFYERALAHPWPNPDAHEEYGMALLDAGRIQEAHDHFRKALQGIDTGRVYLLLAIASEKLGDPKAAIESLNHCLYRWPGNPMARDMRAAILAELGNQ